MKIRFLFLMMTVMLYSCHIENKHEKAKKLIPRPVTFHLEGDGNFTITPETRIIFNSKLTDVAESAAYLADIINKSTGYGLKPEAYAESSNLQNYILLSTFNGDTALGREGYTLQCRKGQLIIQAPGGAGIFYGIQSLLQLAPTEIYSDSVIDSDWEIPAAYIYDKPRFSYRGMHLDVSRHFFPKEFIKKYIDMLAIYKLNVFHWHLTDDNGWRIEIKKYPDLTNIAAWHVDRSNMKWNDVTPPAEGEKATYGGFYTQEEVKEIVQYAAKRHIMIIPEIEMPGHSSEVFAAYPELSCQGKKLYVQPGTYWPNTDILCAGNEQVFEFADNVLTEVAGLFPGPYIHIGGDEADKTNWKKCPKCQRVIKNEGLKDEAELQSWFIKRIEKMVIAKGKRMIGWDEILEGGLAPEATVMSWRGIDGGIEAARQGHDVIMTPTTYCYFDYYQADPEFQPEAIGGFLTLKKVYSYDPLPPVLNSIEAKHILGVQANLWTEYIPTTKQAEYMLMPRMLALAEIAWTKADRKDYFDFSKRVHNQYKVLDQLNVNYSKGSYKIEISAEYDSTRKVYAVELFSEQYMPVIHYTTDGSVPNEKSEVYKKPFEINTNSSIQAVIFEGGKMMEKPTVLTIILHKAIGAKLKVTHQPSFKYAAGGIGSLTNGITASTNHNDNYWLGFESEDIDVQMELSEIKDVKTVDLRCLQNFKAWIFLPQIVEVQISEDGKTFRTFKTEVAKEAVNSKTVEIKDIKVVCDGKPARFIKLKAQNQGVCPEGHPNAGGKAWLFTDEIIVD